VSVGAGVDVAVAAGRGAFTPQAASAKVRIRVRENKRPITFWISPKPKCITSFLPILAILAVA
jgi:hypothetical protein